MYKIYQFIYKKIQEKLETYIKGGEIEEKTSLQKVEITINNVRIKKSALNFLNIPFSVHNSSKIKRIQISVSTDPKLKVSVENLHLVINPSVLRHLNQNFLQERKFEKLKEWEEKQRENQKAPGSYSSKVLEWILPKVLSRVSVKLKNFTILYQDTEALQILGYPSLCILKFSSIKIQRTNSEWGKEEDVKATKDIFILIELKNLSLTMRCDPLDFEKGTNIDSFYDEMKASERNYVVRPCSIKVQVSISQQDTQHSIESKIMIEILNEVHLAINEYQRFFLEGLINFISSSAVLKRYAFLKPKSSLKAAPGEWWKYLISAARHDHRYNILNIIKTQKTKEKYIEYYQRIQRIIQAPVLPGLSANEHKEMIEIEESFMYEEIIEFRNQTLDQIRKKLQLDKNMHMKKRNNENVKKYLHEYYSAVMAESKAMEEPFDEESEESYFSFSETMNKFSCILRIPRIVASINVLSSISETKIEILENSGCECIRCKKIDTKRSKDRFPESSKSQSLINAKFKPSINLEKSKIRGPPRNSLLPSRKMKDIAIEYGEEIYNIGSICYKSHSGDPYEQNIMKEKTLLIVILDKITGSVSGTEDVISSQLSIADIFSFDPLSCIVKDFNENSTEKIKQFSDILKFQGWAAQILKKSEEPEETREMENKQDKENKENKEAKENKENKALWSLRHFMRDLDGLPELEFLIHYYELKSGKEICICNNNLTSEREMQKEFIHSSNSSIHISKDLKSIISKRWEFDHIEFIALKIQDALIQIFPLFLRASLRYFISSLLPKKSENNVCDIILKIAKDKDSESLAEKYVALAEISILKLPFFVTTSCISNLSLFDSPQISLGTYPKSPHSSTFLSTLEAIPDRINLITMIENNWNRPTSRLLSELKGKMSKIPRFTLDFHLYSVELQIMSLINFEQFKEPPVLGVFLKGLRIYKGISNSILDPQCDKKLETIHSRSISPDCYLTLNVTLEEISVETTSRILSTAVQTHVSLSPVMAHPTLPGALIDVHIPYVILTVNSNLLPLLHIINSIDSQSSLNSNLHEAKKSIADVFRITDTDYIHEFRSSIYPIQIRKKTKILTKFCQDHGKDLERCRHCLFKHLKVLSFISLTLGSMDNDEVNGLSLQVVIEEEKMLEVTCKHALCSIKKMVFSTKINAFTADIIASSSSGESIILHPGRNHIGVQPSLPVNMKCMFPLSWNNYFSTGEVCGYHLLSAKQLTNCDIINEAAWKIQERSSEPKKSSIYPKSKSIELDLVDNEFRGEAMIDMISASISFAPNSQLVKSLIYVVKTLSLAKKICPPTIKNLMKIKQISKSFAIQARFLNVRIEFGEETTEITGKDIEILFAPISMAPPIQQIPFTKNKETEVMFTSRVEVKVGSVNTNILDILQIRLTDIKLELSTHKDTKVKIINRILIATEFKRQEKINASLSYLHVSSEDFLIFAMPAELAREALLVSKTTQLIKIIGEIGELYCSFPTAGAIIEVPLILKIVEKLVAVPAPVFENFVDFDENYIKDPSLFTSALTESRIILCFNYIFLRLTYNHDLILQANVHNMYFHNNMPQGVLEKYLNPSIKDSLCALDGIHTNSDELAIMLRKLEIIPADSRYDFMVEMPSEYSLIIKISTSLKKITIKSKRSLKITVVNKVLEELILCLKSIKKAIPKDKKKEPTPDYTVDCDISGGEIIIPENSMSENFVRLTFDLCRVNVFTGNRDLFKPTAIDESVEICKGKQVLHDEYEESSVVLCDLVNVIVKNARIETKINQKRKVLGKVSEIEVDVWVPSAPEELVMFTWKSDAFVNVKFSDAEIKASMVRVI